jgi:hypothetical protein
MSQAAAQGLLTGSHVVCYVCRTPVPVSSIHLLSFSNLSFRFLTSRINMQVKKRDRNKVSSFQCRSDGNVITLSLLRPSGNLFFGIGKKFPAFIDPKIHQPLYSFTACSIQFTSSLLSLEIHFNSILPSPCRSPK